jgi:hypothetical protein
MGRSPLGEPQLRTLAERIGAVSAHIQEPPASLDQLKADFESAARKGELDDVPRQMWNRLPNALAHGLPPLLVDQPAVVAALGKHISGRPARACVRNLAAYYFREFGGVNAFGEVADMLQRALATKPNSYPVWSLAQERLGLFDPSRGPRTFAEQYLRSAGPIAKAFEEVGGPPESLANAFGTATLNAGLDLFSNILTSPSGREESLEQLRKWLDALRSSGCLPMATQCSVALCLLSPWASQGPGDGLRKTLTEVILEYVGDPRGGTIVWKEPQLQRVKDRFLNWLAYGTIARFFEVIDASAEAGHWTDRRSFWASYADGGAVTDAWVAYGPVAHHLAQQSADPTFQFGQLANARLRHHSALLLRIGTLVVADYSHNGSCRFYSSDRWQPEFYLPAYNDAQLRGSATDFLAHYAGWQWRFAQYIRRNTGIRNDYEGSA